MRYLAYNDVFLDCTRYGYKLPKSQYQEQGKYPIIDQGQKQIAGYTDCVEGLYCDVPAIVFGDHTRVFKYVDTPFFLGADGVKLLNVKLSAEQADCKYLFYALRNAKFPATGYNRHYKWLKELEIPLPPLDVQRKIAAILDKAQALIAARREQIALLDMIVKSRFVEMFGDPVTNPMGWDIVDLEKVCTKITDGEHITPKRTSEGIYLLSARNILNHRIDVTDVDYIDEVEYERIAKRVLPKAGDILISCSGSIGRVARITDNTRYQLVRSVAILQLTEKMDSIFVEYCFETDYLQTQIKQSSNQSSQANLFQGKIRKLQIPLPPLSLQHRFADFVRAADKSKFALRKSLYELEKLYKSLTERAFAGELFTE